MRTDLLGGGAAPQRGLIWRAFAQDRRATFMSDKTAPPLTRLAPTIGFADLYTPKLVTILREGYGLKELRADAFAGATVAIVALPLSMAIAIASGVEPARGLYAAIVGGFLVSALGGSRFQIGGPAGAFIVLVAATVHQHGVDGLLLATFLSGFILAAAGFLRLGSYIQLIPYPVTVGFTAGIAAIILASQIKDFFGLATGDASAHEIVPLIAEAAGAYSSVNLHATAIAVGTVALIAALQRLRPSLPAILIAVLAASVAAAALDLPVETVGSRFGGIPSGLPRPQALSLNFGAITAVLPHAFSFALLGAIESLLSATVADAMTGRRHRSNCELAAQGVANIAAPIFGGIVVTGTIARTATNVRAGAHGPVAGILHSLFLLAFMLVAAPLAAYAPLAALAAVLVAVAWKMIEWGAMAMLLRNSATDAAALAATFLLTVFRSLTEAIFAGIAIGALAFIHRMAKTAELSSHGALIREDAPDDPTALRTPYQAPAAAANGVAVYRLTGAIFFASAASLGIALDKILAGQRLLILDFSNAAFVDSSGANAIAGFLDKAARRGVSVVIAGAEPSVRRALLAGGVRPPKAQYDQSLETALAAARGLDLRAE